MKSIRRGSDILCISHRDDVDGLASAALVRSATHCEFVLVDYEELENALAGAPDNLDWLVIADLGLNGRMDVIRKLPAIARRTLYVDHHLLSSASKKALEQAGVIIRHSTDDCASVLVWDLLRNRLPARAISLASYGASTDPPVSGSLTHEVLSKTSRNLGAYEGHLLALALSSSRCTPSLRRDIVTRLAAFELPHRMRAVRRLADRQAAGIVEIQEQLCDSAQVKGRVAIAKARELALGTSAELLLGAPNVVASLIYDSKRVPSHVRISVRGTEECGRHLGKLMLKIARRLGGAGGGHRLAAGAMIPKSRLKECLNLFVREAGY